MESPKSHMMIGYGDFFPLKLQTVEVFRLALRYHTTGWLIAETGGLKKKSHWEGIDCDAWLIALMDKLSKHMAPLEMKF